MKSPISGLPTFYVSVGREVLRDRLRLVLFLCASTMHALGHAALALAAGACVRALLGQIGLIEAHTSANGASNRALTLGLVGLGAVIVKVLSGVYATFAQARMAGTIGARLRLDVLDGWLSQHRLQPARQTDHGDAASGPHSARRAESSDVSEREAGPLARGVAAMTSRVRDVENGLQLGVLGGARAFAQLVPLIAALVWISPKLALVAIAVFVPFSIALNTVRRKWKRANAEAAARSERLLEASDEAVRHADLWTTYGAEAKVRASVEAIGAATAESHARLEASAAALSGANEILGALALVLALAAAGAGWLGSIGDGLVPFAIVFFLAYRPLRDVTDARLAIARAHIAYDHLAGSVLVSPARRSDDVIATVRWPLATLTLRDWTLAKGGLAPISIAIPPGKIVAIVGPTGIGKTTLLRALLGLEAPVRGELHYADASLATAPPGPTARPFAWVPQESPVLADTIDANITLGATNADARAILETLGGARLIAALEGERLGAGGRAISGGERQWIALARAVATELPVLLLDEPTSGLDPEAQARVLEAIARLRGERTVIVVTHRPEPLAIADIVMRVGGPSLQRQSVDLHASIEGAAIHDYT